MWPSWQFEDCVHPLSYQSVNNSTNNNNNCSFNMVKTSAQPYKHYYYYYYRKKRFRWHNVKRLQGHLTNAKDSDKTRVRRKVRTEYLSDAIVGRAVEIRKYMYTYTIIYNEQAVLQDSNNAAHTLPRRTATTQCDIIVGFDMM